MDIVKELEFPIPVLDTDINDIIINISKTYENKFLISNKGGNLLKGEIVTDFENITFSTTSFEGNKVVVKYKIDLKTTKENEMIKSSFVIISNGGEKVVDISIRKIPPVLTTKLDIKLTSLEDFYKFSIANPVEARFIFASSEFMLWLKEIEYKKIELYDYFVSDHNKERGLDNFLLANSLKEPAKLKVEKNKVTIRVEPYSQEITTHTVRAVKTNSGYFKTNVYSENNSPWLHIETKSISSIDFLNVDYTEIDFYINADYLDDQVVTDKIIVDDYGESFIVEVIKNQVLNVYLSKTNFEINDTGKLIIENNSNKDIVIELFEQDEFIKFEGRKYFVGKNAVIPFKVKMSAFQTASSFFRKQPVVNSSILVKSYLDEGSIRKTLDLSIGSLI